MKKNEMLPWQVDKIMFTFSYFELTFYFLLYKKTSKLIVDQHQHIVYWFSPKGCTKMRNKKEEKKMTRLWEVKESKITFYYKFL